MSLIRRICLTGLAIALVFVSTLCLHLHIGGSHPNLGDTFIYLFSFMLGPISGMIAGGFGSCLADLIDYPTTAIMTLIIKSLMGLVAGLLFNAFKAKADTKKKMMLLTLIISFICSLIMMAGYFICKTFLYGTLETALFSLLTNGIQAILNIVLTTLLYYLLSKTRINQLLYNKEIKSEERKEDIKENK